MSSEDQAVFHRIRNFIPYENTLISALESDETIRRMPNLRFTLFALTHRLDPDLPSYWGLIKKLIDDHHGDIYTLISTRRHGSVFPYSQAEWEASKVQVNYLKQKLLAKLSEEASWVPELERSGHWPHQPQWIDLTRQEIVHRVQLERVAFRAEQRVAAKALRHFYQTEEMRRITRKDFHESILAMLRVREQSGTSPTMPLVRSGACTLDASYTGAKSPCDLFQRFLTGRCAVEAQGEALASLMFVSLSPLKRTALQFCFSCSPQMLGRAAVPLGLDRRIAKRREGSVSAAVKSRFHLFPKEVQGRLISLKKRKELLQAKKSALPSWWSRHQILLRCWKRFLEHPFYLNEIYNLLGDDELVIFERLKSTFPLDIWRVNYIGMAITMESSLSLRQLFEAKNLFHPEIRAKDGVPVDVGDILDPPYDRRISRLFDQLWMREGSFFSPTPEESTAILAEFIATSKMIAKVNRVFYCTPEYRVLTAPHRVFLGLRALEYQSVVGLPMPGNLRRAAVRGCAISGAFELLSATTTPSPKPIRRREAPERRDGTLESNGNRRVHSRLVFCSQDNGSCVEYVRTHFFPLVAE
jgi:hypothetical protein